MLRLEGQIAVLALIQKPAPLCATALSVFLLLGLLSACGKSEDKKTAEIAAPEAVKTSGSAERAALTVNLVQPKTSQVTRSILANGNIAAWQEASVGAELTARVEAVSVQVGDKVRRYQELARFATEIAKAEHGQLVAMEHEAEATYADASRAAVRARKLEEDGFMGAQMSSQYYTQEMTAKAKLEQTKAARLASELRLQNAVVRANEDGIISRVDVVVGSLVSAGTPMFRLIQGGRLEWRAEVSSDNLSAIKNGMRVTVDVGSGEQVAGRVRNVAPTVDVQTRAALVYVDLEPSPYARAGLYASGSIHTGEGQALLVPQSALVLRDGFSYAMKVGADKRVQQTVVQIGRRQGDMVEVLSGLQASDRVIATGGAFVSDGDSVNVLNAAPAAAPQP